MHTEEISSALDARLRRWARRLGYSLKRSRRALGPANLGGYMIIDPDNNWVVDGSAFDLGADYVEAWLADAGAPETGQC